MIFLCKKTMYVFAGLYLALQSSSCISTRMMNAVNGHYYKYKFAIREKTSRKTPATYSDNNFTFSFNPQFIRVDYNITNNSNEPIQVHWENTFLTVHDDSSKVITKDIELRYADEIPKPLEIAPGQTSQGYITPIDYVKNTDSGWAATEFYPSHDDSLAPKTDWIMGLIGVDIFKLYIPVTVNKETKIYKFTFYPNEMEKSAVSQLPKQ